MPEKEKVEAQEVLDELFTATLLPFKLCACKVESVGSDQYTVYFFDSRLRSVDISWRQGVCFKDVFRAAVLKRVKRLSGPLSLSNQLAAN